MMKKIKIFILGAFFIFGTLSFTQNSNPYSLDGRLLYIQPMGKVDNRLVLAVDSAVRGFFNCWSMILVPINPTDDLLTTSRTKYDGNKILEKFHGNRHLLIITDKDICRYWNPSYPEWSMWGYANIGGTTSVISTHMLKGNGMKVLRARLIKDALHELCHNVGLQHCNRDTRCLMNDGSAGVSELDAECIWLCDYCRKLLN